MKRPSLILLSLIAAYFGISSTNLEKTFCSDLNFFRDRECSCPLSPFDLRDYFLMDSTAKEYKIFDSSVLDSNYFKLKTCEIGSEHALNSNISRFMEFTEQYQKSRCTKTCYLVRKADIIISYRNSHKTWIRSLKIILLFLISGLLGGIIARTSKTPT